MRRFYSWAFCIAGVVALCIAVSWAREAYRTRSFVIMPGDFLGAFILLVFGVLWLVTSWRLRTGMSESELRAAYLMLIIAVFLSIPRIFFRLINDDVGFCVLVVALITMLPAYEFSFRRLFGGFYKNATEKDGPNGEGPAKPRTEGETSRLQS